MMSTWFVGGTSGISTGNGACGAGISGIEMDHPDNTHIQFEGFPGSTTSTRKGRRSTLTDAACVLRMNGVAIDRDVTTSFPVGTDVTWEVIATQGSYKGILVRLEKSSDDFILVSANATDLQNVTLCDAIAGVAGLSHTSSEPKTSSSGTMHFASSGTATLDVTLVFENVETSVYAWSSFTLNIKDDTPLAPSNAILTTTPAVTPTVVTPIATPTLGPPVTIGPPTTKVRCSKGKSKDTTVVKCETSPKKVKRKSGTI